MFPHVILTLCFLHTRRYALPHVAFEAKYTLRCCPQMLAVNSDSTRMSIIDINGVVSLYDFEAGRGREANNEQGLPPGEHLAFEKRDAWDMIWAEDCPDLLAIMEKSRMYVCRGLNPEEPVLVVCMYACMYVCIHVIYIHTQGPEPRGAGALERLPVLVQGPVHLHRAP